MNHLKPSGNDIDGIKIGKLECEDVGTCIVGGPFNRVHLRNTTAKNCGALIDTPAIRDLDVNGVKWSDTRPQKTGEPMREKSGVGWTRAFESGWQRIFG